ncbi:hypothetical protein Athai_10700 [Actinocatenispora thailandica]|uniref:Uncharacterized protein n=1 Tax=Actinocatenispora thailandica TaxID=227318 RepID=A0A7R7DL17_9ACTN|nr:hypothetical protein Athai_10700 [Actinocatenispora thailandica]
MQQDHVIVRSSAIGEHPKVLEELPTVGGIERGSGSARPTTLGAREIRVLDDARLGSRHRPADQIGYCVVQHRPAKGVGRKWW